MPPERLRNLGEYIIANALTEGWIGNDKVGECSAIRASLGRNLCQLTHPGNALSEQLQWSLASSFTGTLGVLAAADKIGKIDGARAYARLVAETSFPSSASLEKR
jgi:hypothetical protein